MRKLGCFGFIVAAALAIGAFTLFRWYGPGPAEREITVLIKDGSSLTSAARQLEEAGAIGSAGSFLTFAKFLGDDAPIHSGEYRIPAGLSASEILEMLQSGRTLQRFVTVPEGMPSILVHEKLMKEPLLTGTVAVPREGSVLPDSYSFERGERRAAVVKRMQAAMDKTLAELWAKRKPGIAVSTPAQAVTLASIVEKETGVPSERRTVASVYTNRLKQGMKLQADPTTIYPVTKGKPLGRRILRSELTAVNGYNTYAIVGLPVGPIANPGRESIAAVLDPAQTNYLYFVADGKGGHVFAETLGQHNANVQKWYAIRRERGEM
ncbi:endolytic transglycosylase MltG [Sphingomonas cavernae]|uniref:Endolytic murein transglycosylase n=1 Tax=Sphingomonas cavernae TaxID=2320861 RepID=A0A418WNU7_9SPHN|nr:endolytic transglycosylase MltG [Sphingomonas cavernae]RJF92902.1 endolytic transglycosylase MltG [Sphingomonas cavernae]